MDISKFLAKVLGLYLIIVSVIMLVNINQFTVNVTALLNDSPLMFVTGFFTLILGVVMVVSHTIWQWNWRVLITIISWLTVLKGIALLLYPQYLDKTSILVFHSVNSSYISASIDLIIGLMLSYFGFKKENRL